MLGLGIGVLLGETLRGMGLSLLAVGLETLLIGSTAAALAFAVGLLLGRIWT